jgi:ferredoxin
MPQITAQGKTFNCPEGANLRQVLLAQSIPVHNDQAALINCRGLGTFLRLRSGTSGTCAVEIEGQVSPPGWREQARLSLPPHHSGTTRRLACQVKVLEDAAITKFSGFWGQGEQRRW